MREKLSKAPQNLEEQKMPTRPKAFLSLSDAEADILLANVEVIDGHPGLVDDDGN